MYLDYAESQAERRKSTTMQEWAGKLESFLEFNDHQILADAGRVSHNVAKKLAETEYEKFTEQRRIENAKTVSDFDALVEKAKELPKK